MEDVYIYIIGMYQENKCKKIDYKVIYGFFLINIKIEMELLFERDFLKLKWYAKYEIQFSHNILKVGEKIKTRSKIESMSIKKIPKY